MEQEIKDLVHDMFRSSFNQSEWEAIFETFSTNLIKLIRAVEFGEDYFLYRCKVLDYEFDKRFYPYLICRSFSEAVELAQTKFENPNANCTLEGVIEVRPVTYIKL